MVRVLWPSGPSPRQLNSLIYHLLYNLQPLPSSISLYIIYTFSRSVCSDFVNTIEPFHGGRVCIIVSVLIKQLTLFLAPTSDPSSIIRSRTDVLLSLTASIKGVIPVVWNQRKKCILLLGLMYVCTYVSIEKTVFISRNISLKKESRLKWTDLDVFL